MKHLLPILLVLGILSTASKCKDDVLDTGTISLNIKAQFNDQPLILNQVYDYNGKKIRFSKLSFYLESSEFTPTSSDIPKNLKFDYNNIDSETKAKEGVTQSYPVFEGSYTALKLNVGIGSTNNAKNLKISIPQILYLTQVIIGTLGIAIFSQN